MNQALKVEQLSDRISHLEEEVKYLRNELAKLQRQTNSTREAATTQITFSWADKEAQRRWIDQLFTSLSIHGAPMGPQALQQKMRQASLTHNELSRSLIEAREE